MKDKLDPIYILVVGILIGLCVGMIVIKAVGW